MPPSPVSAIVLRDHTTYPGATMEPILMSDDDLQIQWRAEQLRRRGLSPILAETVADLFEWQEIAMLIARGCLPDLAPENGR
jgi:hypothetical protein